ncbi:ATP-binding protein [Streptomyces sp. YPW6]|uniref:ATP-binding protein n=1 Tax=Streptomyces sp. YPW6 TaxID=2840373 RepID=UPI003EBDD69C
MYAGEFRGLRNTGTARLARLLATEQLRSWGLPLEDASLVIGELATDAALHGYAPGRDFRIMLSVYGDVLRIEVADTWGDRIPEKRASDAESEGGRGLLLVEALSVRWGTEHGLFPRKTVWAEVAITGS